MDTGRTSSSLMQSIRCEQDPCLGVPTAGLVPQVAVFWSSPVLRRAAAVLNGPVAVVSGVEKVH